MLPRRLNGASALTITAMVALTTVTGCSVDPAPSETSGPTGTPTESSASPDADADATTDSPSASTDAPSPTATDFNAEYDAQLPEQGLTFEDDAVGESIAGRFSCAMYAGEENHRSLDGSSDPATLAEPGPAPDWAHPVAADGELITAYRVGDLSYRVLKAGLDTPEEAADVTEDQLLINVVITNEGEPFAFAPSLNLGTVFGYADFSPEDPHAWEAGSAPAETYVATSPDVIHQSGITEDTGFAIEGIFYGEEAPDLTLDTGESISMMTTLPYRPGEILVADTVLVSPEFRMPRILGDPIEAPPENCIENAAAGPVT